MRDLAPEIVRQRLLIEGLYQREITRCCGALSRRRRRAPAFDAQAALDFTRAYFAAAEIESRAF
jgi:hypothetical protein